jgi:hypothetical protein
MPEHQLFWNLFDARRKIAAWQTTYNCERPHSAVAYRTPEEFAQQWKGLRFAPALTRLPSANKTLFRKAKQKRNSEL